MPIVWRFLLSQYLRVLFFCAVAFIAVLLTTRLDDIAHFATLGAGGLHVLLFTLHQIPYILPFAIPISSLISSIILIKRLSNTHEITALRSFGMSLQSILAPVLIAAAFLSAANFYIVSEMATQSHLVSGLLKNELRSINPLLLLHNKHLMRLKGFYFDSMGVSRLGESASDVIIAMPNHHTERLNLMVAKQLESNINDFSGQGVTLISSMESEGDKLFDPLVVENMKETTTTIADFAQIVQKKVWTIHNDYLRLPLLLVRLREEEQALKQAKQQKAPSENLKPIKNSISQIQSEIVRRVSIGFAVFTFTLMGAVFGISISRNRSKRGLMIVIALAAFYLISYFIGKAIETHFLAASAFFLLPHLIIIAISLWTLKRTNQGVELW